MIFIPTNSSRPAIVTLNYLHLQVKAVPAVIAIKNGIIVDKFIGLVDADMITGLIERMSGKKNDST